MSQTRVAVAVLAVVLLSCGAATKSLDERDRAGSSRSVPGTPRRAAGARYVVPDTAWIERTEEGLDRVVVNGRRMEVRGVELVRVGSEEIAITGGGVAPSWAGAGPWRYVFWSGRELYGAPTFLGELRRIATLPAEPLRAFDWLGGCGVMLQGGAVWVSPLGNAPSALRVPLATAAIAADTRRGLIVDLLGRAHLTLDAAATFRDITAELGDSALLDVRGGAIVVVLRDGRERVIDAAGRIEGGSAALGPGRAKPPAEDIDVFGAGTKALSASVESGALLADGGAVISARGFVGRLDLATLRTTSVAALAGVASNADCAAVTVAEASLLVCTNRDRASVVEVTSAPRVERTFELEGTSTLERFAAVDAEALGFVGACDGAASPASSAAFCVRASRDEWIEHRLDPTDAPDVLGWIPRSGGAAVAIVGRAGMFIDDGARVTVRGRLRIVRVARGEPPLAIPDQASQSREVLSRDLHIGADDVIEGWLPGVGGERSVVAVTIDAVGRVRAFPSPPRTNHVRTAGRFALAQTDDWRLFETVDGGRRWAAVDPPPNAPGAHLTRCSPVACRIGPFVRVGWSQADGMQASDTPSSSVPTAARVRNDPPRKAAAPHVRLSCMAAGPAEGKRVAETYAFGYVPGAPHRGSNPIRLGTIGIAVLPWNGAQMTPQGDAEIAWLPPLDPGAVVRRAMVPLARAGIGAGMSRPYELRLGYMLGVDGGVELVSAGHRSTCVAGVLDLAGVTRPIGACVDDPSVGVDLGDRIVLVHLAAGAITVSAANVGRATRGAPPVRDSSQRLPVAVHELHRTPTGGATRGFQLAAGARAGGPVLVALDATGEAILAPIDAERGTLGVEEKLRPLSAAMLGNAAACTSPPRSPEARVVLPFDTEIALDRSRLSGVYATGTAGVAVLRWSSERVCLDAVELAVRDDRFDTDLGAYEPPGTLRKVIARFTGTPSASLVSIGNGSELRQRLACTALVAGDPEATP